MSLKHKLLWTFHALCMHLLFLSQIAVVWIREAHFNLLIIQIRVLLGMTKFRALTDCSHLISLVVLTGCVTAL